MSYGLSDELTSAQNELANLRLLRAEVQLLLCDLTEVGFGKPHNSIHGGDTIDIINERWVRLKEYSR